MYKLKQPNKHIRSLKIINNNLLPYLAKIKNGSIIDKIKANTKNKYKKNLKIKGCFRLRKKIGVVKKISNLISTYHNYSLSGYQSLYQNIFS